MRRYLLTLLVGLFLAGTATAQEGEGQLPYAVGHSFIEIDPGSGAVHAYGETYFASPGVYVDFIAHVSTNISSGGSGFEADNCGSGCAYVDVYGQAQPGQTVSETSYHTGYAWDEAGFPYQYSDVTYDSVEFNVTGNPPSVTGLQQWPGGYPSPGGSGYLVLYGTDLTTQWGPTSVTADSGISTEITYVSPNQVNVYYTIDGGASPGTATVWLSTPFGSSSQPFTIYPTATTLLSDGSLAGGVQDWQDNGDGTFTVALSPLLWDYLGDNDFVAGTMVDGVRIWGSLGGLIFVPGAGQVVITVGGAIIFTAVVVEAYKWWVQHKDDRPPKLPRPKDPPTGTVPLDQYPGLTHDQREKIKRNLELQPEDWTGVAPNGDVITGDLQGNTVNNGPWQGLAN